ncbi:class I SAM-dependent methyltransferase [Bacteroidota bacterium]
MSEKQEFSFGDNSVAKAYDNDLVRYLFEPWAAQLIEEHRPWEGRKVLDLATGTGIVAQLLADQVGPGGSVTGTDINSQMLELANKRCNGSTPAVKFIECPAHPLEISDNSIDIVVCQQGFQFFPDKLAAALEIYRVLHDGGKIIASTWQPVSDCEYFGAICDALNSIDEPELADMMRVPFDFMPGYELTEHFKAAGFVNVQLTQKEQELVIDGGLPVATKVAYSTPIGPKLRALTDARQDQFRKAFTEHLHILCNGRNNMGRMVSNVLTADKPD